MAWQGKRDKKTETNLRKRIGKLEITMWCWLNIQCVVRAYAADVETITRIT